MLFDLPIANQVRVVGDGVAVGGSITKYLEASNVQQIENKLAFLEF